jgi:hypothetical protein
MIDRIVFVKLKEVFANADERSDIVSYSREALSGVPGVLGVSVAVAADERAAADWDLCITVRFDTLDDVALYAGHPDHRAYVDEYLRPKVESLRAWNFEPV